MKLKSSLVMVLGAALVLFSRETQYPYVFVMVVLGGVALVYSLLLAGKGK